MAKGDVVAVEQRPPTKEEAALVEWFDKQKAGQVETLEAAARQIIQLVSALFGLLFGVLSLGRDKLETSLTSPLVITSAIVAVLALLVGLLMALAVTWPRAHQYNPNSLTDQKAVYEAMLGGKARYLAYAMLSFGLGVAALAGLILAMLLARG